MPVPLMEEERLSRTEAAETAVAEVRSIAPVRMLTRIFLLLFFIALSFPCVCTVRLHCLVLGPVVGFG